MSDSRPWYKQFWPWFLIAIPVLSIILSSHMLYLAVTTKDSLVVDDYYKEGKAINRQLAAVRRAQKLGISTELSVSETVLSLEFISGQPESGTALELFFQHPTLENKDFRVLLTRDAGGIYRAELPHQLEGKWKLNLHPLNGQWKIQQPLSFNGQQQTQRLLP
ncbi:hypothetical protein HMF8227_01479 [Saliniradius amylolyticus]|uniref:Nitrogen fixation protein FixH n=1 Tax=Saliniradius amylolyticus TaxID=2183582 RepID=A0A2S2E2T8_9ALTE|nr:FixH family protein [Saliniradius amylolyticus]AWL11954.1 hypothetical protein HMF8227_01479 [Saliniradius amylolyticus]